MPRDLRNGFALTEGPETKQNKQLGGATRQEENFREAKKKKTKKTGIDIFEDMRTFCNHERTRTNKKEHTLKKDLLEINNMMAKMERNSVEGLEENFSINNSQIKL